MNKQALKRHQEKQRYESRIFKKEEGNRELWNEATGTRMFRKQM